MLSNLGVGSDGQPEESVAMPTHAGRHGALVVGEAAAIGPEVQILSELLDPEIEIVKEICQLSRLTL